MLTGPITGGIVGVCDIIGGCEFPSAASIHGKGDIFGVIVLIARKDVEDGSAVKLGEVWLMKTNLAS